MRGRRRPRKRSSTLTSDSTRPCTSCLVVSATTNLCGCLILASTSSDSWREQLGRADRQHEHHLLHTESCRGTARKSPRFTGQRRSSRPTCLSGRWQSRREAHSLFVYAAPALGVEYVFAALALHVPPPVVEYVSPAPAVSCAAPASAVHAAPAPVAWQSTQLQRPVLRTPLQRLLRVRGPRQPSPH